MTHLKQNRLAPFSQLTGQQIVSAAKTFGGPVYLYDEQLIREKCRQVMSMPNAFGLKVRYAIKANAGQAILQLIASEGLDLDLSSLNEVRRAYKAGISYDRMMLTTQEVHTGKDREDLYGMLKQGMIYNACSLQQLDKVADFVSSQKIPISIRINPGVGAGESVTRNTGDKYSSFGIHLANIEKALALVKSKAILIDQLHVHIGSGGDPDMWRENIDRELDIVQSYFKDVKTVNLGGGFKEARMPDETAANIEELGFYAKERFHDHAKRTGRKLEMSIEPGTYIVANSGFLIAQVIDEKWSGPDGFEFIVLNAGMESNTRPLLYGSRHPFYIVSAEGNVLSSEFDLNTMKYELDFRVIVGQCCESGDSQSLDNHGHIIPRMMADPQVGDFVVIGGCGAYCSAMSLANYNSHPRAAEVMLRADGRLQLIRKRESLDQLVINELPLE